MPAGDLIVADWQAEVNALLMGAGTNWEFDYDGGGVGGVFGGTVRDVDVARTLRDGSAHGTDSNPSRVLTVPLVWAGTQTAGAVLTALPTLEAAWDAGVDAEFHLRLPTWGHNYLTGRTRGATVDMALVPFGACRVLCTFVAGDPEWTEFTS